MTDMPASLEFRAATAEETRELGARIAAILGPGDLVVLTGPLGAGKTTLVQGLAEGLKVRGPITSPTFVIARVHPSLSGGPALVHVDAYRIGGALEIDDLDLDASLADSVTVVEWGEGLVEGLSEDRLEILIKRAEGDERSVAGHSAEAEERMIRLTPVGPRWATTPFPRP
ncbi:tRNA (adenosine(37)-N6)-threonylcarbamoyltransferase complex ATPase subunit type 1 TsaE [Sphaerimonospora sp. CA-214678]|uniref:tRNA (adenosine(37)-N6)-threonylcarbamoyltransferase complex ATPase subunit type 1 TsaE n=1 Tax=Sphaerimonospora sp. CA-214678 TaxID=3240029 RepID=UPI003D909220